MTEKSNCVDVGPKAVSEISVKAEQIADQFVDVIGESVDESFENLPYPGTEKPDFRKSIRDLDEMAIAFDLISVLDGQKYVEIHRPSYTDDSMLRASVFSDGDDLPAYVIVARLEDENSNWKVERRIPATILGSISYAGDNRTAANYSHVSAEHSYDDE